MSNQLAAARQRVSAYINRRKIATGLDIERVHCFDNKFDLLLSDLVELVAAHEAAKPAPTAFMGVNPRTGTLEFCAHQPSPSVMRDFDMKPLYAAPVAVASPWIPVTERLPEPETRVLATYTNELGNRRRIIAKWVPAKTVEADSEDEEGVIEYDEDKDCYWLLAGWYEQVYNWGEYSALFVNEGAVDFWQPLSPAPKEQA